MGKVLITKINGNFGDEFPVLGALRIKITGTSNNNGYNITGNIITKGSSLEWKGVGIVQIGDDTGELSFVSKVKKEANGILLINDKYNVKVIDTTFSYGANVMFEDLKYCKELKQLLISNSEQEGDLSEISDIKGLTALGLASSKITGDISYIKDLSSLQTLSIANNKTVSLDFHTILSCSELKTLNVSESYATGDLNDLVSLKKLESISSSAYTGNIHGSISSLANNEAFIRFSDYYLLNTWSNASLRPSSMKKITGNIKFSTASDTDNFIKNMAECAIGDDKTWFFQNSHRTSASDSAVQKLQQQGYTLSQLITD